MRKNSKLVEDHYRQKLPIVYIISLNTKSNKGNFMPVRAKVTSLMSACLIPF